MKNLIKKGVQLGIGLGAASREQVEKFVDEMVKKGAISLDESKELVDDVVKKGEEEQTRISNIIRDQVEKLLANLDIATKEDLAKLEKRLQKLEDQTVSTQG